MTRYVAEGHLGYCGTDFVLDLGECETLELAEKDAYDIVVEHAEFAGIIFREDYFVDDDEYSEEEMETIEAEMEEDALCGMILDCRGDLDYEVREYKDEDENEID